MFCPRCSQQLADRMRFCSRCRFPLGIVGKLVTTGGISSEPPLDEIKDKHSPRWRGVCRGTVLAFIGMILSIMLSIMHDKFGLPEIFHMLSTIFFFGGGLFRILYAAIFEEGAKK